jgi:hypothetical protein
MILSALAGVVSGQPKEPTQTPPRQPRFGAEAHAGLLELRVRRPDGRLVWNLTRDDFVVREAGAVRPIVLFEPPRTVPVSVVALFDASATVGENVFLTNRELIFRLIHLLEPSDEVMIGVFDNEQVSFLTGLTSDRKELVEALWSLSPSGRPGRWSRLGHLVGGMQLGNDSLTGLAIDESLLRLKAARHSDKLVLVLSSGFGSIGPGTLDHLDLAGARLFAVVSGRQGFADTINLGGNRKIGLAVVQSSGGLEFACDGILAQVGELRDSLKKYYVLAYAAEAPATPGLEIKIKNHPEFEVSSVPRVFSPSDVY